MESQAEFQNTLRALIEGWCDRRCYNALRLILPSFVAFNGLGDAWGELRLALTHVRSLANAELTKADLMAVHDLLNAMDRAAARNSN